MRPLQIACKAVCGTFHKDVLNSVYLSIEDSACAGFIQKSVICVLKERKSKYKCVHVIMMHEYQVRIKR